MTFAIPEILVERIARRQSVLCAGLGLGQLAGLPSWRPLAQRVAEAYQASGMGADDAGVVAEEAASGNPLLVLSHVGRKLGSVVVADLLQQVISEPPEPPPDYAMLAEMPFRGVVTTGYDGLVSRAFGAGRLGGPELLTLADGPMLQGHRGTFVVAAHGSPTQPETLILGRGDLQRALKSGPEYRAFMEDLFARRSLVLMGFAPDDPDLSLLLEGHLGGALSGSGPHFLVTDGIGYLQAEDLRETRGIITVPLGGDPHGFLSALAAQVASRQEAARPDDDDVQGWLEVLSADPQSVEALDALDHIERDLREQSDWDPLVDLLLGRLDHEQESASRLRMLREVARIFEQEVGDLGKAFTTLQACLREDPEDEGIIQELERLAHAAGLWTELVADYAEVVQGVEGPAAVAHWVRLGQWYSRELGHREYAISSFKQAISLDPESLEAHAALAEELPATERWDELAEILQAQVKLEHDPIRLFDVWLTLGDLYETRLSRPADAVQAFLQGLELEPESSSAVGSLERLYRRHGYWRDLCALLERRAAGADDPETAADLRHEAGEIKADHLDDPEGAITLLETVVQEHPHRLATLRALEKLYDRAGRDSEYLGTLERMVDAADSDDERLLLLRRLAAEQEERDAGGLRPVRCLEQILEIRPDDEDAHRALVRILRHEGQLREAAEAITRHIGTVESVDTTRELYRSLGQLYEDDLGEVQNAIDAYENVVALGHDDEALIALMRLRHRSGDAAGFAETALRRAEAHPDPDTRAELIHQAGRVAAEELGDHETAEARYVRALEISPGHLPSLNGLIDLYRTRGDYLRAAHLMAEAEGRTQNRLEKTRLLFESGCLYQDHLDEVARAEEQFARALAIDPEHEGAGERLADLYVRHEQWANLEPVLDMLARKVDPNDTPRVVDLNLRLAQCCRRIDNQEKALRAYEAAYAADPVSAPALRGLADLLYERAETLERPQAWGNEPDVAAGRANAARAAQLYDALIDHYSDSADKAEQLTVYERLTRLALQLGEGDRALQHCDRALALEPDHRPSLEAAINLLSDRGDWPRVIEHQRTLAGVSGEEEQADRLEAVGDIYLEHLEDPLEAGAAYEAALELMPNKRGLLSKLLDLYSQQKSWHRAVEMISRLCDLEQDSAKRAKFRYTAAVVFRDQLHDEESALEHFDLTLDDAPDITKAFEAQERILTTKEDWKGLARAYSRMIKRLPPEGLTDLRLKLWQNLGEICLNRLGDTESAIAALEVATTLDPKNLARQTTLAELYIDAGPDHLDKAITAQQLVLQRAPERLTTYRTLRKLYGETQQWDKMWCVCGALSFLKKADADEQRFFEAYRPRTVVPAKRKLTDALWQKSVMHADEDRFLAATFSRLGGLVALLRAQSAESYGFKRKERVDPDKDSRPVARMFRYVYQTLDVPPPDCYLRDSANLSVQVANTQEKGQLRPSLVIEGAQTERLRERELLFELSKRVAFLRPERFVRYAWPTPPEMETALRGILLALQVQPPAQGLGDPNEIERVARELRRALVPQALEPMAVAARMWIAERTTLNMSPWVVAADLTSSRAGFILCNDFETAARQVSKEGTAQSPLPPKDRLKHLLAYSVSEDYFTVRRHLGLQVEVQM